MFLGNNAIGTAINTAVIIRKRAVKIDFAPLCVTTNQYMES